MECIFCKIINGEIPSYKVYEDESLFVFLDINPNSPGHCLIVPKEHTLDLLSIDNNTLLKIFEKSKDIAKLLVDKLNADGFTLIQNNGCAQDVKHFHLHVIPKYKKTKKIDIKTVYDILTK